MSALNRAVRDQIIGMPKGHVQTGTVSA
jgi:hypothetical protein